MQFESESQPGAASSREQPALMISNFSGDCYVPMIVSGTTPDALQAVEMTRRYGGHVGGSILYSACENPTEGQKEWLKRNSLEYIKPKWRRFLSEVTEALGGKNILKGCKCSDF